MSLKFRTIVQNRATGNNYACEVSKDSFDNLRDDAVVQVFARSVNARNGQQRTRRTKKRLISYFTPFKFQKSFLAIIRELKEGELV